jgi:Ala-tRNA(Pro) deacylase
VTRKAGKYLLAVVPGDKHVDLLRLSRLAGGRKAAFAVRDVAERLAGTVSGSIPPIPLHPGLELIVDTSLLAHEEIYFNAARLDCSVALRTADYLILTNPRIERIATDAPVRETPLTPVPALPLTVPEPRPLALATAYPSRVRGHHDR